MDGQHWLAFLILRREPLRRKSRRLSSGTSPMESEHHATRACEAYKRENVWLCGCHGV